MGGMGNVLICVKLRIRAKDLWFSCVYFLLLCAYFVQTSKNTGVMKKIIDWYHSFEAWTFRVFDKIADSIVGRWLGEGGRWAWMIFGLVVGLSSCNWYNACHSGAITAITYVLYYRCEYKRDHSWTTMILVFLCSVIGQGIVWLLTEK